MDKETARELIGKVRYNIGTLERRLFRKVIPQLEGELSGPSLKYLRTASTSLESALDKYEALLKMLRKY